MKKEEEGKREDDTKTTRREDGCQIKMRGREGFKKTEKKDVEKGTHLCWG